MIGLIIWGGDDPTKGTLKLETNWTELSLDSDIDTSTVPRTISMVLLPIITGKREREGENVNHRKSGGSKPTVPRTAVLGHIYSPTSPRFGRGRTVLNPFALGYTSAGGDSNCQPSVVGAVGWLCGHISITSDFEIVNVN